MKRTSRRAAVRRQYRQWRAAVDLTQRDVAERSGVSLSRYYRIENWYAEPSAAEQARLTKVFKLTPEQFDQALSPVVAA